MANWASTDYKIEGNSKDLQEIFELFCKFDKGERKPFDEHTDKEWEGNIVWALGGNTKELYLRGFIQVCELEDGILSIAAEEAWGVTDFRKFLENHYKDMKVYYCSEEEGCDYFQTNDKEHKYFGYTCMIHSCVDGDENNEYFETKKKALEYIAERLKVSSITMEEIEEWNKKHEGVDDNFIVFNEYQIVD